MVLTDKKRWIQSQGGSNGKRNEQKIKRSKTEDCNVMLDENKVSIIHRCGCKKILP